MKRILSFALTLVIVLPLCIGPTFAMTDEEYNERMTKAQNELASLKADLDRYATENHIVRLIGVITQKGSPYNVRATNVDELATAGIPNTALICWIRDTSRAIISRDSYQSMHQYLGEDYLYRDDGTPITVNVMGPVPDAYYELLDLIAQKEMEISDIDFYREQEKVVDNHKNEGTIIYYGDGSYYVGEATQIYSVDAGASYDVPNGYGTEYDLNDNIVFQGNYIDGLKNGIGTTYNAENGLVIDRGNYVNGEKDGIFVTYFAEFESLYQMITPNYYNNGVKNWKIYNMYETKPYECDLIGKLQIQGFSSLQK